VVSVDRSRRQPHSVAHHHHHRGKRSAQADPSSDAGYPAEEAEGLWLDAHLDDSDALAQLLEPSSADAMEAYDVSRLANSASNDLPEVTAPLPQLPF